MPNHGNQIQSLDKLYTPSVLKAWLICLSAGLFFFYQFVQLNIFDVINTPLRQSFQLSASQISLLSSAFLAGNVVFLLPAGILLDRFSSRLIILYALMICIIGTLGFSVSHSFITAYVSRFLTGIGNAFCFLSCVILIGQWFPPKRQAFLMGLVITMAFMGGMVAHTPFYHLSQAFGWRIAMLINAVIGIVLWTEIFYVVEDSKNRCLSGWNTLDRAQLLSNLKSSLRQVTRNSQNWYAGIYTAFLNLPIMVLCALWGASFLQVAQHVSVPTSSNIISLIYVGSIIGCPLVGWVSDKQGLRKPLMLIGSILTLGTMFILVTGLILSESQLKALFLVVGLVSSTQVLSYPLIAESNSNQLTGTATAMASIIIITGAAVAQIIFGTLMQYHAGVLKYSYSLSDYQFAIWIFPIAALFSVISVVLLRETYCKATDSQSDPAEKKIRIPIV